MSNHSRPIVIQSRIHFATGQKYLSFSKCNLSTGMYVIVHPTYLLMALRSAYSHFYENALI